MTLPPDIDVMAPGQPTFAFMATFMGTFEELRGAVEQADTVGGEWSEKNGCHSYRSRDGGILNWWPSTGKVSFQGKPEASRRLEAAFGGAKIADAVITLPHVKRRQIFVVHGQDNAARNDLELMLRRLDLEPFILMTSAGEGKTLIEALEGKIGRDYSADFGICLFTPDDYGYSKTDGESKREPRPRQNVVLETGMLLASLTRSRMVLLVKGHMEMPSNLSGIIQIRYNDHIREVVPKLCQRLTEAGIELANDRISLAMA